MTPEQQVAFYTPTYSILELVGIGLCLVLMFAAPTAHWFADLRRRAKLRALRKASRQGWYEEA